MEDRVDRPGRQRSEAVEAGLDQRERVAVAGRAGDEEVELALAQAAVPKARDRVGEAALGIRGLDVPCALDGDRGVDRGEQLARVDRWLRQAREAGGDAVRPT